MLTNLIIRTFVKDYKNLNSKYTRDNYGNTACITGICSNLLLFILKISLGFISGSIAIISDAFNNLADLGSGIIVLFGFKISHKPADKGHPFGHGRSEYISGFIVAILIIVVAVQLFINSFTKILNPEKINTNIFILIGLSISVIIKLWMYFFYKKISKTINSTALKAAAMDSVYDCVSTGVVILSVIIFMIFKINLDAYFGIVISIFIFQGGIKTVFDTVDPLLGTSPPQELCDNIKEFILKEKTFLGVHDLIVHSYGAGRMFASVHVEVPCDADVMKCHELIDECEKGAFTDLGIHLLIHMDPIVTDDEETNHVKSTLLDKIKEINPEFSIHDFRLVKGEKNSNLIFDLVLPAGFTGNTTEIEKTFDKMAKELNPKYSAKVTFDIDF